MAATKQWLSNKYGMQQIFKIIDIYKQLNHLLLRRTFKRYTPKPYFFLTEEFALVSVTQTKYFIKRICLIKKHILSIQISL